VTIIVMHLRSFSSGDTTKFFNLNLNLNLKVVHFQTLHRPWVHQCTASRARPRSRRGISRTGVL